MQVRELSSGCEVQAPLLVREVRIRARREDGELLLLRLGDRTGSISAVVSDGGENVREACREGEVVWVGGTVEHDTRFGTQIVVDTVRRAAAHEWTRADLLDGPTRSIQLLEQDLRELLATIQRPCLRGLLAATFDEGSPLWARFRMMPAAKHYHQAYRGGLLEHSITVAQAVSAASATFPDIDRDVAVAGRCCMTSASSTRTRCMARRSR
jgi:3'-5' exoribonuclease